ncbi:MAG: DUF2220 domain-containing protein [Treponema sp.]|jgi:hypothetical protein|nr:DUF2220 domain-containing protein [Treponema sp.]
MLHESTGKELLSILLDKYERSVFFRTGTTPTRRIRIRLYDSGLSDYKRYNIENAERRQEINRAVLELAGMGLVRFRWMKREENHIIAQVSLNADTAGAVAAAYSFLGRKPGDTLAGEIGAEISDLLARIKSPWMRRFLEDCREALSRSRLPGGRIPADSGERRNLFRALLFADGQAEKAEVLERAFSIRCFGDSKIFETSVKKRFLDIIRRYSDCEDDSGEEELLAFAGIVRYPERFEFRGPLAISFAPGPADSAAAVCCAAPGTCDTAAVDFSPLRYGASLGYPDFKRGRLYLPPGLARLFSIENKANYISYIHQNPGNAELVVYHGGQFSPSRGAFFRALSAAAPEGCPWYHWGDIDYGGFSMLARLRREIRGDVRPYRMDERELARYAALALPVTEEYAGKLKDLARRQELADCLPCVNYMIENHVRLEQEAMISDEA